MTSSTSLIRPLIVLGTRPEAVKLAPLILECRDRADRLRPTVCSTGQHREMLAQVLGYFGIQPDVDLGLMKPNQTLTSLTAACLTELDTVIRQQPCDCVVAQGDTTTVMAAAMTAFYHRLPFVHVEAGLRTGDLDAPWPEEFNRRVAGIVTTLHCAPTEGAADALRREHVADDSIRVTGNTVIDALMWTVKREREKGDQWARTYPAAMAESMVLITGHRRENFGEGLANLCNAIAVLSRRFPETQFIYPVHLNPQVKGPVHESLGALSNVHLVPPANYPQFVWLMDRATVVLTDSGGVQEEAPSLGCAVLVTRDKTERPEAVQAGLAELVGTDRDLIIRKVTESLKRPEPTGERVKANPYGDGQAAKRIADWIEEAFSRRDQKV